MNRLDSIKQVIINNKKNILITIGLLAILTLILFSVKTGIFAAIVLYFLIEFMFLLLPFAVIALIIVLIFAIKGKYCNCCTFLTILSMWSVSSLCMESCYVYDNVIDIMTLNCQLPLIGLLVLSLLVLKINKTQKIKQYIPISIILLLYIIVRIGYVAIQ